jgi:putative ABC transport system permease protein
MQDLRDALRALKATPVISAVAILSLALGVGANTAIFSLVDSVLLKSLPVRDPERLVMLTDGSWTNPIWEQIRERQHELFERATAFSGNAFDLASGGEARPVNGLYASGEFFDVLGVPAVLGRTFTPNDDRRGGGPDGAVTVISYRFWQNHFGGAADVIGRSITLSRVPFTIIGVTPSQFFGPAVGEGFDVIVPIGTEPLIRGAGSGLDERSFWWLEIMARLKPGQTLEEANTALGGVQPRIREATLPQRWRASDLATYLSDKLTLEPAASGQSYLRSRYQRPLLAIMVVVALVLLIACANIANLMLARTNGRRHEISIRRALGATRTRLARQFFAESLLLSAAGAALGLAFAHWGSRLIVQQLSTWRGTVFLDLPLDWRVLGFTAAVAIATAVLFGTAPALRATTVEPNESLKEQGRSIGGEGRRALGTPLVVAQVALSLVLIVAAGLFVRTFITLATRDLGFSRERIMVVAIDAEQSKATREQRAVLFDRVARAVAAVPGVDRSAASAITPVSGMMWNDRFDFPELPNLSERERSVNQNFVTPGWFATYDTPMIAGRDFTDRDKAGSPSVAIVNEAFLDKFMKGKSPLGRTVLPTSRPDRPAVPLEIVGVVRNAVYRSVREPAPPIMYRPLAQAEDFPPFLSVSVTATSGSPSLLIRSIVDAVGQLDRDLSLTFRPLAEQVNGALAQERVVALLSGFFGLLALLLAAIGLYGVTSYAVSRRRTEIGIRMALGADANGVVRLVLRRVALLVVVGIAIGAGISLWAARFVSTLLYGLEPRDPVTLIGASAVLALIGALAGWLPARRAARIDPAVVLRQG